MIPLVKHSIRFLLFAFFQAFIFNQLEIGWGLQFMIYPLFIFLLPIEMPVIYAMLVSFLLGGVIDSISNTYGLHASSAVLVAYLRPMLFKIFEPRDGYEANQELTFLNADFSWIIRTHGLLLLIHHFWFFTIEIFKFNEILYIFQKTFISLPVSFLIMVLIQYVFVKRSIQR